MTTTNKQQRVALRQVALRAGVSLGTASNVFANKPGVALSTRMAVLNAAAELGYQPALRHGSVHADLDTGHVAPRVDQQTDFKTFGLVIRSMHIPHTSNPFYSHVLHGAEQVCTRHHVGLMYAIVSFGANDAYTVQQLPLMIQREQVQGLLLVGYFPTPFLELLQTTGIPFVIVDHYVPSLPVDSVNSDNEEGAYQATKYLIERGYRQPVPAMIAGPLLHHSLHQRLLGYRRALAEYHLVYDERYIAWGDTNVTGGYQAMGELLNCSPRPRAVFCCSDLTAIGAMNALQERGLRIPEDISLVGFDDIDMAEHTQPPLTTMRVDKALLGIQAVRHLLDRLEDPSLTPRHTRIAVQLVERRSVQPYSS